MKRVIDNEIFTKDYQNSLKPLFESGLKEVWGNDSNMVSWSMKQFSYLIPICGGKYLIELEKPKIENEFYFGYSDIGQGRSYDENNKLIDKLSTTIEDYFVEKNLEHIDSMIFDLKNILDNKSPKRVVHYIHYYHSDENSPIHSFSLTNPWGQVSITGGYYYMESEDIKNLIDGYTLLREDFKKRLITYIKKYGDTKIRFRTYWIDR